MALRRPLSTALNCQNCQQWILRSFISSVGGPPATERAATPKRPFSVSYRRPNEGRERIQQAAKEDDLPLNEINEEFGQESYLPPAESTPQEHTKQQQNNHIPWYLQAQQHIQQPESPIQSRQKLPEIPDHAPPILQPLLEHVSREQGMDDLVLLDLRTLDPPPALGSNLLMIVGTARSEKHLHVSADRLCRWLRSEYRFSPHADGLLGRNELKLKLKRRAKRSKLLSAVGAKATAQTEVDDGIRTGWVCVNIRGVEGGVLPGQETKKENIVGFGPETQGSTIVLQLLTEEKRSEIDLESLWEDNLTRARKRKEQESAANEEVNEGSEEMREAEQVRSAASSAYQAFGRVSNQSAGQQARPYHTSARRMYATAREQNKHETTDFGQGLPQSVAGSSKETERLANMIAELKTMDYLRARRALGPNPVKGTHQLDLDFSTLLQLRTKYAELPQALSADVVETSDEAETSFLRAFYNTMPEHPAAEHWHYHIELLAQARRHGGVHSTVLFAQLKNMQIAGLVPQERTFKLVIEAALGRMGKGPEYDGEEEFPSSWKLNSILDVLEDMEQYGYDPVSPDILTLLYKSCVGIPRPDANFKFSNIVERISLARLHRMARTKDWPAFWQTWRSYPQRFLPRTAGMYAVLFSAIGEGHLPRPREAAEVLRSSLEEMEREQPPVRLDIVAVADAAMRAIEFVEPKLDTNEANKEWQGWYEQCLNARITTSGDTSSGNARGRKNKSTP